MEKFAHWSALKEVKHRLLEEQAAALEEQRRLAKLERERIAQANLFQNALGRVTPLATALRAPLQRQAPAPIAHQFIQDEKRVLQESLSDDFEPGTLLEMDETLSYRRAGIGVDVTRRLRKGDWSIQAHLDLHGLRRDQAREAVGHFVKESHKNGLRCLRVVHGKGLGSEGKTPILKAKVQSWLVQKQEVIAFVQAKPIHGGAGALVVLLDAWPSGFDSRQPLPR